MKFETDVFGYPRPFKLNVMKRMFDLPDGIFKVDKHIITVQTLDGLPNTKRLMLVDRIDGGCSRGFEAFAVNILERDNGDIYISTAMKKAITFWLMKELEAEEVFTFFESISEKGEITTISLGGI